MTVALHTEVSELIVSGETKHIDGVVLRGGRRIEAKRVILATGGVSYPSTGSTGDGLRFAKALGHTIIEPRPGLTGIMTEDTDIQAEAAYAAQVICDRQNQYEKTLDKTADLSNGDILSLKRF